MPEKTARLLIAGIAFLKHGSLGACPQPVFDVYQGWQRELVEGLFLVRAVLQ